MQQHTNHAIQAHNKRSQTRAVLQMISQNNYT